MVDGITVTFGGDGTSSGVVSINADYHITVNFDAPASATMVNIRDALAASPVRHLFEGNIGGTTIDGDSSTLIVVTGLVVDGIGFAPINSLGFTLATQADSSLDGETGADLVEFDTNLETRTITVRFGATATVANAVAKATALIAADDDLAELVSAVSEGTAGALTDAQTGTHAAGMVVETAGTDAVTEPLPPPILRRRCKISSGAIMSMPNWAITTMTTAPRRKPGRCSLPKTDRPPQPRFPFWGR